jgi:hypothetical protein
VKIGIPIHHTWRPLGDNTEQFLPMIAMEAHLATDTVALFDHRQNVRGVLPECPGHPIDIASKLIVANECRPERAAEGETFVENFRYQALVGMVPHVFVEHAHHFLLR